MLISMFIFKLFFKSIKVWSLTKTKNIFLCCNPCVLFDEFMIGSLSMKSVFKKELCKFISGVREMYACVRISNIARTFFVVDLMHRWCVLEFLYACRTDKFLHVMFDCI